LFIICAGLAHSYQHHLDVDLVLADGIRDRPQYWETVFAHVQHYRGPDRNDASIIVYDADTPDAPHRSRNNFIHPKHPLMPDKLPLHLEEVAMRYEPIVHYPGQDYYIFGYFQAVAHIAAHWPRRKEELGLTQQRATHAAVWAASPLGNSLGRTVALHFRLGDYFSSYQHIYIILREEYYVAALSALVAATHRDDWTVLCFEAGGSEADSAKVGALIGRLRTVFPRMQFTAPPDGLSDVEQFFLMSLCLHQIIANSTFSWWAAFLNTNPLRWVFYPSHWFTNRIAINGTGDLIPDHEPLLSRWQSVPVERAVRTELMLTIENVGEARVVLYEHDDHKILADSFAREYNLDEYQKEQLASALAQHIGQAAVVLTNPPLNDNVRTSVADMSAADAGCVDGDMSCERARLGRRLPKVAAFCVIKDDAYLHPFIVRMSQLKSMNDLGTSAGPFLDAKWTYFVAGNLSSASIARVTAAGLHASHVSSYIFESSGPWTGEMHWWTLMPEALHNAGFDYSLYIDGDVSTLRPVQVAEAMSALDTSSFGMWAMGSGGGKGSAEKKAAIAAVGAFWPAPMHKVSWSTDKVVSRSDRPNINTGVLFMDNQRLVELSFATRYERAYTESLQSDFWAAAKVEGWAMGDIR
jgi:hypothetical protein